MGRRSESVHRTSDPGKAVSSIRAVTFDVGGTWIEPWPSVGHIYAEVARGFGIEVGNTERLTQCFFEAWAHRGHFEYTRNAWQKLVEEAFSSLPGPVPDEACFAAIYSRFAEPVCWNVFKDVRPALHELAAMGCKLGLISNWDERLRPLLQKMELLVGLDAVVISHEVGEVKPARRIFDDAAKALSLSSSEILHVGDSRREDVDGAGAAGFQAVLLNRAGKPSEHVIASLAEVPGLVRRSNAPSLSAD